jgi:hypothetical protein
MKPEGIMRLQIYSRGNQFNIAINNYPPSIKFEERELGIYTVITAFHERDNIDYSQEKNFSMDENITKLLDVFPDAFLINEVVTGLLDIK